MTQEQYIYLVSSRDPYEACCYHDAVEVPEAAFESESKAHEYAIQRFKKIFGTPSAEAILAEQGKGYLEYFTVRKVKFYVQ